MLNHFQAQQRNLPINCPLKQSESSRSQFRLNKHLSTRI